MANRNKAEVNSSSKRRGRGKPWTRTRGDCRRETTRRLLRQKTWLIKLLPKWEVAKIIRVKARGLIRIWVRLASILMVMTIERYEVRTRFSSLERVIDMLKTKSRSSTTSKTS